MQGKNSVPIDDFRLLRGIEDGGFADDGRRGIRFAPELQPSASVQLQIQHVPNPTVVPFSRAICRTTPCRNPERT